MKSRRHHNNTGKQSIRSGGTERDVRYMARACKTLYGDFLSKAHPREVRTMAQAEAEISPSDPHTLDNDS